MNVKVFDAPSLTTKSFEERVQTLKDHFASNSDCITIELVEHVRVKDAGHVESELKHVESLGGEGLMLRKPGSLYEAKRSNTLLKVKSFYDAEARVTGYEAGKGKYKGSVGSLKCVMESGRTFKCGTGLSDEDRRDPPKVGDIISYRFFELTSDGEALQFSIAIV